MIFDTALPQGLVSVALPLCALALAGTAAAQSGLVGTIRLANGQTYPVEHVLADHPSTRAAMPTSDILWRSGNRQYLNHCYYLGRSGKLDQITLYGVLFAYQPGAQALINVDSYNNAFAGQIKVSQLVAAGRSVENLSILYAETLWRISGGDLPRAIRLLRGAEERDAQCSNVYLNELRETIFLNKQNMTLTRDNNGRPIVIRTDASSANEANRKVVGLISEHIELVRTLIPVYRSVYQDLLRRSEVRDRSLSDRIDAARGPGEVAEPRPPARAPARRASPEPRQDQPPSQTPDIPAPRIEGADRVVIAKTFQPTKLIEQEQQAVKLIRLAENCFLTAAVSACR